MNRLIVACASALFLVACTAESATAPKDANPPAADGKAVTGLEVKLELGKNI